MAKKSFIKLYSYMLKHLLHLQTHIIVIMRKPVTTCTSFQPVCHCFHNAQIKYFLIASMWWPALSTIFASFSSKENGAAPLSFVVYRFLSTLGNLAESNCKPHLVDRHTSPHAFAMTIVGSVFSGNLASVSVGLSIGWVSLSVPKLREKNLSVALTDDGIVWCSFFALLGMVIGLFLSLLSNVLGRKKTLLISALPFIFGWFPIAFANSVIEMCIGNLLIGTGIGITAAVIPIYFCEISPISCRGAIGCTPALFQQMGIILAFILDSYLPLKHQALISITLPLMFCILFARATESPYYLALRGQYYEADRKLVQLRATSDIDDELKMIMSAVQMDQSHNARFHSLFSKVSNRIPLFALVVLVLAVHFSGYQIMVACLQKILFTQDTSLKDSSYIYTILAVLNIVLITGVMFTVDYIGRKPLLMVSTMGTAICVFIMAFASCAQEHKIEENFIKWLMTTAIVSFFVVYNIGLVPIPKFLVGELFPTSVRPQASVIIGLFDVLSSFFVVRLSDICSDMYGTQMQFFVFIAVSLVAFIIIKYLMHETKGKSLGEVQSLLAKEKCTIAVREAVGKIERSFPESH